MPLNSNRFFALRQTSSFRMHESITYSRTHIWRNCFVYAAECVCVCFFWLNVLRFRLRCGCGCRSCDRIHLGAFTSEAVAKCAIIFFTLSAWRTKKTTARTICFFSRCPLPNRYLNGPGYGDDVISVWGKKIAITIITGREQRIKCRPLVKIQIHYTRNECELLSLDLEWVRVTAAHWPTQFRQHMHVHAHTCTQHDTSAVRIRLRCSRWEWSAVGGGDGGADDDSVVVESELACFVMYQHSVSVPESASGHHK